MVTTKTFVSVDLSLFSMEPWLRSFLVKGIDRCRKSWQESRAFEYRINYDM